MPLDLPLRRRVDVRDDERAATVAAFLLFFFVLSAYFVLRPIRDAVAAASGVQQLPWLFAGTLAATLAFNPVFAALVVRFPARRFVPIMFELFAANLLIFYVVMRAAAAQAGSPADVWSGRTFYVWTSVLAFFGPSIFWCLMADAFRSDQAKRLFGVIGVGGTLGSITGSALTATLARTLGPVNLLLVSAALLQGAVLCAARFPRFPRLAPDPASADASQSTHAIQSTATRDTPAEADDDAAVGGGITSGFTRVFRSPYLFGIAAFLALYSLGSTFLYFQQSDIVGRTYADRAARTAVLAQLELAAQILTVVTQTFFTARIIRWIGLTATLAVLPLLSAIGFGVLGALPVFATLTVFTVLRRASNFSLTNPAMETLFTVVPREDKYKAKSFIETFIYRGGDQLSAWTYAGLASMGLGLSRIAFVAVPVSLAWMMLAVWLGRAHERRQQFVVASSLPLPVSP